MSCDTVSASTEPRIHIQLQRALGLGGKDLAWSCQGQGQDFFLKAKAKAKIFMRCPRGSTRPRPDLEDNKTAAFHHAF